MSESVQPYRPLLLLGRGGMGSVEAAAEELPDGTTRVVALKRILRAGAAATDAPRVEMFLRESRLTTLLEHKNVIRSLAYGETDGELFLAMEYVAGEPLSRLLAAVGDAPDAPDRRARLPLPVLAYILAEACEGLHAAHELRGPDGEPLGVVHRDVSPQNVMVGYDGSVKLLDFGVAKIDLLDCAARTKTGEVKGKTAYMSPEQAMGEVIDARSDLYSVGAVLFECVTGRRMWGTGTDLDVLRKLALEEPPRLADLAPDAPAALDALFARLVARDRTKRPGSAQEVAVALRAFAAGANGEAAGDAASVESAMSHLFPGESERREAAIASALAGGPREGGLPVGRATRDSGDSGPVFVTHHGPAPRAPSGFRHAGWLASGAAAIVLFAAVGVAIHGRTPSEATAAPPSTSPSGSVEAPRGPVVQTAPSPATPANAPGLASPASPATPTMVAPTKPGNTVRRVASPRPGPSAAASPRIAPTPAPSTTPAPQRAPEPPDVDPTPF